MRLTNKKALEKLKRKNRGNTSLSREVDRLIDDLENNSFKNASELHRIRIDTDCAHSDGFYFFDMAVHRTMILIEFEDGEATVVWVGSHSQYERTFRNNKSTIEKWLRANDYID